MNDLDPFKIFLDLQLALPRNAPRSRSLSAIPANIPASSM